MITYKAVCPIDGKYFSATAHSSPQLAKEYRQDEWTIADIGGLLSFYCIGDAKLFCCGCKDLEIWEAEAKNEIPLGRCAILGMGENLQTIQQYWRVRDSWISSWPFGTIAHKRLRLIKKVWPEEKPNDSREAN